MIILAFLLAISAITAADNATSDVVSVEGTTECILSDNEGIDNTAVVEDNSTSVVDFDLLDGEGYKNINNTVSFNLTDLNAFHKTDNYYIFDYSDGKNTKELSVKYCNTYEYNYNLNLTNNSDYNYTFYGHRYSSGNLNAQPWSIGQYSSSNLVLQGSFNLAGEGNGVYTFEDGAYWKGSFYAWTLNGNGMYYAKDGRCLGQKTYEYNTAINK